MTENAKNKAVVLRPSKLKSHERGGGASTTPLVTPLVGSTSFINGITTLAPSAAIPFHSHNCEESVMLLVGEAVLEIYGETIQLQPQDTTWVPADVSHRFRNLSDSNPMTIFWTYASPDATRTLTETAETNFISAEQNR
jgi:quercetin dioxygenase-like cupin family protein